MFIFSNTETTVPVNELQSGIKSTKYIISELWCIDTFKKMKDRVQMWNNFIKSILICLKSLEGYTNKIVRKAAWIVAIIVQLI